MKVFKKIIYPYVIFAGIFILIPMILMGFYAFTQPADSVASIRFTFDNFIKFFTDEVFVKVMINSIRVALITTVICLIIGYPIAYFISKKSARTQMMLILLITIPMWINMLIRTYAWISILDDKGILNSVLEFLNLPQLKIMYTETAVIIGMVYNFLPFMIIQIYNVLARLDQSLLNASYDLGANRFQTFKRIVLPLSIPGIISGITLVFLPSVSTFSIPALLGGGQYMLIGSLIENQFINVGEWNYGSAISFIMMIIILISMYLTKKVDVEKTSMEV